MKKTYFILIAITFNFILSTFTCTAQWQHFNFPGLKIYNTNSKYMYSVAANSTYFLRTTDDWQHWDTVQTGFPIHKFAADSTGQVLISRSMGNYVYDIYLSQHQDPFNLIFTDSAYAIRTLYVHKNCIYLFNSTNNSYASTDNGNNFYPIQPVVSASYYGLISVGVVRDSIIYAYSENSSYYGYSKASFDYGMTWPSYSPDGDYCANVIIYADPYIFFGRSHSITRSVDVENNTDTCSLAQYTLSFAYKNGVLLAGTSNSGVNTTLNKGNTWAWFNDGLDSLCCNAIVAVTDSFYYVMMNNNTTYRRSIHDLTGINSLAQELPLQLYPNPAADYLTIKSGNYQPFTYQLINMQGSLQKEGRITNSQTEINVTDLPRGMYILKVVTEKQTVTKKVLLQ